MYACKFLYNLKGHEDSVRNVAFSPDDKLIVTSSFDKTARVWQVQTGKLLYIFKGHEDFLRNAVFSPDGKLVITASDDKTARIWKVFKIQELIDYAYKLIPRCLTSEQRKQYFLPPDPSYDLIEEGKQLAKQGDIKAATAKFKKAKDMAPCHKFLNFPEDKALEIAAISLIEKGEELATNGQTEEAVEQFKQAQQVDERFKFGGGIEEYTQQLSK